MRTTWERYKDLTQLLQWLDKEEEATIFVQRAGILKSSLRDRFWNAEKGLFADALLEKGFSNKYSEHANGMALALKIADKDQGRSIVEKLLADDPNLFIKRATGMTIVTPALSYFLHKGIAQYGHVDASFDLLRKRFDHMLAPNTTEPFGKSGGWTVPVEAVNWTIGSPDPMHKPKVLLCLHCLQNFFWEYNLQCRDEGDNYRTAPNENQKNNIRYSLSLGPFCGELEPHEQ